MKSFKELGLSHAFLKNLEEFKFGEPTEIQEKVIPLALQGKDIIGASATGSGKTLAFGAPIIENLKKKGFLQALIVVPTRELAEQVSRSLRAFSKQHSLKVLSIYGGVSLNPQIEDLRYADIVVGTPGRILDHISRRTIDLSKINFLVLDEADRMLDMGFIDDVFTIIEHCPAKRQTMLFSATISQEIAVIAKRYMNHPVEIHVESYVDASKLEQVFYDVPQNEKFSLLVHLLKDEKSNLVMVFCSTKRNADFIGKNLRKLSFDAMALHGDLSQNKRNKILEYFHKSSKFVLVCTDVAARGLDIKNVSHVYNYDSPKNNTEYIHRVGRTARAGKEGKAITILGRMDYDNFRRVLQDGSLKITKLPTPEFERIQIKMSDHRRESGRAYGRSYGKERRDERKYFGRSRSDEESDRVKRSSSSNFRHNGRSFGRSDSRSRSRFGSSRGRDNKHSSRSHDSRSHNHNRSRFR
ncbi:DEAD/DEAH box helicase [Candidatus Pacearchaeota archaeon]|nr:DEAD/DEAH box helicase [Candidatus Pacearchaeota archaeon]